MNLDTARICLVAYSYVVALTGDRFRAINALVASEGETSEVVIGLSTINRHTHVCTFDCCSEEGGTYAWFFSTPLCLDPSPHPSTLLHFALELLCMTVGCHTPGTLPHMS